MEPRADASDGSLVFTASRKKWLRVLLGCAVFVALAVRVAVKESNGTLWLVAAFFGLGVVVAGWQLIAPSKLIVRPTVIEVKAMGRSYSRDLVSCSEFKVWRNPMARQSLVVFDHPLDSAKRGAGASKRLSGHSGALPDTFGLQAVELADLLNTARAAAQAQADRTGE